MVLAFVFSQLRAGKAKQGSTVKEHGKKPVQEKNKQDETGQGGDDGGDDDGDPGDGKGKQDNKSKEEEGSCCCSCCSCCRVDCLPALPPRLC